MIRLQYSHLCCLIHDSLHSLTEQSAVSMTKKHERGLLIVLSQVLNQVRLWTCEFDSCSDSDHDSCDDHDTPPVRLADKRECVTSDSMCHSLASQCIFKIINDLVFLLSIESGYVQHLAGNVLVAISGFVVASESYWDDFMQNLCFYLELVISKLLSHCLDSPIRAKVLDFGSSTFKLDLQPVLNNASWHSVGGIILVLHNILKKLKHEHDDQLLEVYLNSLGSCLSNIPWDLCNEIATVHIGNVSSDIGDVLINNNVRQSKSWFEFCGYLVQLFCSLVSQISLVKHAADSLDKNPVIREILTVFPKVLVWCLGKQGDYSNDTCISRYIRHKILVLMIKLSSLVNLDCEMAVSWLHLINKHFQDHLFESVTQLEAGKDDCLRDSPFLMFLPAAKNNIISHQHLQRQVVFLYLKCSFSLINSRERAGEQHLCGVDSYAKEGFRELYEWLQRHLPPDILVNSELYSDRCKRFTKSFLQLYMHEDDMLFEVLLLLSHMPFGDEQHTSQVVEKNTLFLLSEIFHPIHLFHLFLSELHYDHQVLLDYLISKDTGARCAEYLLRCLRIICDSWNSFLGFSFGREIDNQSSRKRRKVLNDEVLLAYVTEGKNKKTRRLPFHDATECLLSLKSSVQNLHRKELFPYNPKVLLQRLTRFQELT